MDAGVADFGLMEKDVQCAIMTIIAGVDSGSLCGILGVFPFDSLFHIASEHKKILHRESEFPVRYPWSVSF